MVMLAIQRSSPVHFVTHKDKKNWENFENFDQLAMVH